jgi:hypothetical protein
MLANTTMRGNNTSRRPTAAAVYRKNSDRTANIYDAFGSAGYAGQRRAW